MLTGAQWADFASICREAPLPVCNLWIPDGQINAGVELILPTCQVNLVNIGGSPSRNLGDLIVCVISMVLTLMMMYRAHSKYAAVGRKEMEIMFSFYIVTLLFQILSGGNFFGVDVLYIVSAIHIGFIVGFFVVLMLNGLVGYQFVEDGGALSVLGTLLAGLLVTALVTIVSLDVPLDLIGNTVSNIPYNSSTLYGLYLVFPLILVIMYTILMTVLVVRNLGDQKPLINLFAALAFFVLSLVFTFAINTDICNSSKGAVNGTVFASVFNLVAVIFVYRFWDAITEDSWDDVDDIFV